MPTPIGPFVGPSAQKISIEVAKWLAGYLAGKGVDAMLDPGPVYNGDISNPPLTSMSPFQIVNNISIESNPDPVAASNANAALQELASREDTGPVVANHAEANAPTLSQESQAAIKMLDDIRKRAIDLNGLPNQRERVQMTPDTRKALRRTIRKPVDRLYVSKEFHEYDYCKRPVKRNGDVNWFVYISQLGATPLTHDGTYGTFVDANQMRKAISLVRRLQSVVYGQNGKRYSEITGQSQMAMFISIFNSNPENAQLCAAAADQWNDLKPA